MRKKDPNNLLNYNKRAYTILCSIFSNKDIQSIGGTFYYNKGIIFKKIIERFEKYGVDFSKLNSSNPAK